MINKLINIFWILLLLLNITGCTAKTTEKNVQIDNSEPGHIFEGKEKINVPIDRDYILNMPLEDILKNINWYIEDYYDIYSDHLIFLSNNEYCLSYCGSDEYARGKYEIISDNNIKIIYPSEIYKRIEDIASLFQSRDELLLELQRNYIDFYCIGKLYSEELGISLFSSVSSPQNEEYEINHTIVIKRAGRIRINQTLNARLEPSINAPFYTWSINFLLELNLECRVDWLKDPNARLNVVFHGMIYDFDAITKQIDEIDGYSKPWYRIVINNYPLTPIFKYFWVYGGYVDELDAGFIADNLNLADNYTNSLINYLFEKDYIKDEISKEFVMEELFLEDSI